MLERACLSFMADCTCFNMYLLDSWCKCNYRQLNVSFFRFRNSDGQPGLIEELQDENRRLLDSDGIYTFIVVFSTNSVIFLCVYLSVI